MEERRVKYKKEKDAEKAIFLHLSKKYFFVGNYIKYRISSPFIS